MVSSDSKTSQGGLARYGLRAERALRHGSGALNPTRGKDIKLTTIGVYDI